MKNIYHRDIIEILLACGQQGMKLCRIARKVYNKHADLFVHDINYEDIHKTLGMYMWKQSRKKESPIQRNSYGIYSIKDDMAIQLDLFWDIKQTEEDLKPVPEKKEDKNQLKFEFF